MDQEQILLHYLASKSKLIKLEEEIMRPIFLAIFLFAVFSASAFECNPFGPSVDEITVAQINTLPHSYGVIQDEEKKLILLEGGSYNEYSYGGGGLTIKSIWQKDENTLMVTMGDGSYSDGVWDFDLSTHSWTINEWFAFPNFMQYCSSNSSYYLGTGQGTFVSPDAETWTRIQDLGMDDCTDFTNYGEHLACLIDNYVYTSHDSGQTWQDANAPHFETIRFTDTGVLYGIMAQLSDSDGLWRSYDYGETWDVVFYSSDMSCIGPNFGEYLPLGWSQSDYMGSTVFLLDGDDNLIELEHPNLYTAVKQMDIFHLINTPSFYVLNDSGCFYLTNFLNIAADDPIAPEAPEMTLYPNPNHGLLRLKLENPAGGESLKLYNLRGQLLQHLAIDASTSEHLSWDLNRAAAGDLPSGMYFVRREDAAGKVLATKRMMLIR
jgi:hypothetical protein